MAIAMAWVESSKRRAWSRSIRTSISGWCVLISIFSSSIPGVLSASIRVKKSSVIFNNCSNSSPDISIFMGDPTGGPFSSFSTYIFAPTKSFNAIEISCMIFDVLMPSRFSNSTNEIEVSDLFGLLLLSKKLPLPFPTLVVTDFRMCLYGSSFSLIMLSTSYDTSSVRSMAVPNGSSVVT